MRSNRASCPPSARRRPSLWLVLLACLLVISPYLWRTTGSVASQTEATPPTAATGRLDLAAVALDAGDLPDGYELQGERYTSGSDWAETNFPGDDSLQRSLADAGLEWWYESTYGLPGTLLTIRVYVEQYAGAAGARAGFDLLEDEARFLPPNVPAEDVALQNVDADPAELTLLDAELAPGFFYRSIDATFGDGRVLAGVAMESVGGTTPPERGLVEGLAVRLQERLEEVLVRRGMNLYDPPTKAALLQLDDATILQEGYLSGREVVPDSSAGLAGAVVGAYFRTVGFPFPNQPDTPPVLFVNLAIAQFASPADAGAALYALESLAILSPLPPPGESFRQQGALPEIVGADAVNAVRRALLPGGLVDSVRLGLVIHDHLAMVEVAGAASLDAAEETAAALASLEADCILFSISCQFMQPIPDPDIQALALETAPAPASVSGDPTRAAVFDQVWRTINDTYLYRTGRQGILYANFHEVDWNAIRAEYEPLALAAASDEEFHQIVGEMVAELGDQHTGYLSPEEARADDALFAGQPVYVGIGALLAGGLDPNNPGLILSVFPDSPAAAAGLGRRDVIEAIDGEVIAAASDERAGELRDAIDTLTAPGQAPADPGPPVTLAVRSPGAAPREVVVGRAVGPAPISPVVERLASNPSIAYVLLIDFVTPDLNEQLVAGIEALVAEGAIEGIVLDVRANPGGSLFVTQSVLSQFVSGRVGAYYSRDGTPPQPFDVEPGALFERLRDVPVVVLTDDRMYSASEVTTSVLQNEGRATVVGVTSPGDVEVLIPVGFPDGSRLYLAVQLFDLPGRTIEGQGILPDVLVAQDWIRYPMAEDPQIAAAVGIIQLDELGSEVELGATPAA